MRKQLTLILAFLSPLTAMVCPRSDVEIALGARSDKLQFNINARNGAGAAIAPQYHFDSVSSWQAALRAQAAFFQVWYVRGVATYANIGSADVSIQSLESPATTVTGSATGHSNDFAIALGRAFALTRCISIAPVFGWGTSTQQLWTFKMGPDYYFKEIHNGPFIGFDLLTRFWNCLEFDLGYELHYVAARAKVQFPTGGLSPVRAHAHTSLGNLGWLQLLWNYRPCWHLGLRAEGLSYVCQHGTLTPSNQGTTYNSGTPSRVSWSSGNIALLIGRDF